MKVIAIILLIIFVPYLLVTIGGIIWGIIEGIFKEK